MKAVVLEKTIGKSTTTRIFKHGYMTVKVNGKIQEVRAMDTSDLSGIVTHLINQGYVVVETDYNQIGDPVVQQKLL